MNIIKIYLNILHCLYFYGVKTVVHRTYSIPYNSCDHHFHNTLPITSSFYFCSHIQTRFSGCLVFFSYLSHSRTYNTSYAFLSLNTTIHLILFDQQVSTEMMITAGQHIYLQCCPAPKLDMMTNSNGYIKWAHIVNALCC